jgi:hypothetical protein
LKARNTEVQCGGRDRFFCKAWAFSAYLLATPVTTVGDSHHLDINQTTGWRGVTMYRATGPGKIEVDKTKYNRPGAIKALLYNFDFDDMASTTLKSEHANFLSTSVVPILAKDRGRIWLRGSASSVGGSNYNKQLSQVRVNRVVAYLRANAVNVEQMQPEAVGEDLTNGHAADDERDRAVEFIVRPKKKGDPPPPRTIPRPQLVSQDFKLAMLAGIAGSKLAKVAKYFKGKIGAGFAVDALFFIIWDTRNNLAAEYFYLAEGIGAGLMILPPFSASLHGPWNAFTTSVPLSCDDFDGMARFTTAGIANKSVNWIHLLGPTIRGAEPVYMMINTGTTIGAGISTTLGAMKWLGGPNPYFGP